MTYEQTKREAIEAAETYLRPPDEPYPRGDSECWNEHHDWVYYDSAGNRVVDPNDPGVTLRCCDCCGVEEEL